MINDNRKKKDSIVKNYICPYCGSKEEMTFEINNDKWTIKEKSKDTLKELYEKETQEKVFFVFGVTIKSKHVIYINKDMCKAQKIKTLKHELAHCYIWEYGLYNVIDINEEVICDIVASSNDFINSVVEEYKKGGIKNNE